VRPLSVKEIAAALYVTEKMHTYEEDEEQLISAL
jgi:hypothetical protein